MKQIKHILLVLIACSLPFFALADDKKSDDDASVNFSDAELAQILAPIALYPDTLLSHILIASTYPIEVVQADRWAKENPDIKGADAVEAVDGEEWDPSVKALAAFPQVLDKMSDDLDWTQKLGDAFLADEERLLAMVQELRKKAYKAGNLQKMDHYEVTKEDNDSIVIEPREKEIVYVPYYDTRVVYGPWSWYDYPPFYWSYPPAYHVYGYRPGLWIYWGPRVHLSYNFWFSAFHWHQHRVVVIDHYYYRNYNHRYYRARSIARDARVTHWRHNPVHRRGVSYRDIRVSRRYNSNRPPRLEVRPAVRQPGGNRVVNRENSSGHRRQDQSETLRQRERGVTRREPMTEREIRQRLEQTRAGTRTDRRLQRENNSRRDEVTRPTERQRNTRSGANNRAGNESRVPVQREQNISVPRVKERTTTTYQTQERSSRRERTSNTQHRSERASQPRVNRSSREKSGGRQSRH